MTELREQVARMLWYADQDSIETPFESLTCGPVLDNLFDLADQLLAIPAIREALETHEMVVAMEGWGVPRGNPTAPSRGPDQRL